MDAKKWFGLVFVGIAMIALGFAKNEAVPPAERIPGALSPEQFAAEFGQTVERTEAPAARKAAAPKAPVAEMVTEVVAAEEEKAPAREERRPAKPKPAKAAGSSGAAATSGGKANTVSGRVTWSGDVPKNPLISMASDKVCESLCAGKEPRKEVTVVGDDGGLANVVVYIGKGLPKQDWPVRGEEVVIDQHGCTYVPHVVALQLGQKISIKNSDDTTHNVHFKSKLNGDWNMTQSSKGSVPPKEDFKRPEVGSALFKCDIHTWMEARAHIFDHPFFAVTDEHGNFEIKDVPAGSYTVVALHEKWKDRKAEVTVTDGAGAKVDFEFSKKK